MSNHAGRRLLLSQKLHVAIAWSTVIAHLFAANKFDHLVDTSWQAPPWHETEFLPNLPEVGPIITPIISVSEVNEIGSGNSFTNQLADLCDRVILCVTPDVKNLLVNQRQR